VRLENGTVLTFGDGRKGQLGHDVLVKSSAPRQVLGRAEAMARREAHIAQLLHERSVLLKALARLRPDGDAETHGAVGHASVAGRYGREVAQEMRDVAELSAGCDGQQQALPTAGCPPSETASSHLSHAAHGPQLEFAVDFEHLSIEPGFATFGDRAQEEFALSP